MTENTFVDLIIPLAVDGLFTYACTPEMFEKLEKGIRVAVPFGKSQIQTGIVYRKHHIPPDYPVKSVLQIIDNEPILNEQAFALMEFMVNYYLTSYGKVLRSALPRSFLIESKTFLQLNRARHYDTKTLSDTAYLIIEALEKNTILNVDELSKITGKKSGNISCIHRLIEENIIRLKADIRERYKPKTLTYVLPAVDEAEIGLFLDQLPKRAIKQRDLLLKFLHLYYPERKPVPKKKLLDNTSPSAFKALIDKGILKTIVRFVARQNYDEKEGDFIFTLNEEQTTTFHRIRQAFNQQKPVLLHGLTATGKTEIYMQLIEETIAKGEQALLMVPEIALTLQLVERIRKKFPGKIAIYHSKYDLHTRREIWTDVLHNRPNARLILGTRSAVFLPYKRLGLIVVDEEHDESYKEFYHEPFYQARDMALVLGKIHGANVILGSATPSLESYTHARNGKYVLTELFKRYHDTPDPELEIKDLRKVVKKNNLQGHFAQNTLDEIRRTVENGHQVIVFINRRGYAPIVECRNCGHIEHCPNCSVSLTYHKNSNTLKCHYCGYQIPMTHTCRACGSNQLEMHGAGTQQIASELNEFFPDFEIDRLDTDTTKTTAAYERILQQFDEGKTQILVGTQMLSKGLDFDNVALVVVVNADRLMRFPDFRAHERAFQLLMQVSGRTGRRMRQDKIIIQTYQPGHPVLGFVQKKDYQGFYAYETTERQTFGYPPYLRLIKLVLKAKNPQNLNEAAGWIAQSLRYYIKDVLGPSEPPVFKIKNYFHKEILIKIPPNQLNTIKEIIKKTVRRYRSIPAFRSVRLYINPDP